MHMQITQEYYIQVEYLKVLHVCMCLLTCEFTITHFIAVAVTPVSQVHMCI